MAWKVISPGQLNRSHVGKPAKVRLKDGKEIYGAIQKVDKGGIWFIPVKQRPTKQNVKQSFFLLPFLIFVPFGFFTPIIFI